MWPHADTVVFLDLPKRTVVRRVVVAHRAADGHAHEWWSGNREPCATRSATDDALIPYLWKYYPKYRKRYEARQRDPAWSHLEWIRLRSASAVRAWLRSL